MLNNIIFISLGAVFGAVLRHYVSFFFASLTVFGFSWGILLCNIIGSFIMGAFIESGAKVFNISQELRFLIATGFLGSFTTFSTFAMETVLMFNKAEYISAIVYIFLSVVLSIIALYLGMNIVKVFA
ncbi:MAG: fluoride efflux transporter CrcB [Alphaproteobacteria bacterium]